MKDESLLELFESRAESAITELSSKYGAACMKLAHGILNDERDAEECVSDAYLVLWNSIPPKRPQLLGCFLLGVVRNLSLKRHRTNSAQCRNSSYDAALEELTECVPSGENVQCEAESKELSGVVAAFLDGLSSENRVIFLRRYWFCESHAAIAERVGFSEKNVSVRLSRIRRQLKVYLIEKEYI